MKMVQISEKSFTALYILLCIGVTDEEHFEQLAAPVRAELEAKMEAMIRRDLYTKSKIAPTAEEREKARQEYLDRAGILKDWRY